MIEGDCYECGLNEECEHDGGICVNFDSFKIDVDFTQDPPHVEITPVVEHAFIPTYDVGDYEGLEVGFR